MAGRMRCESWISFAAAIIVLTSIAGRAWAAKNSPPRPAKSDILGGKERFLAHVSTDKPIYRIGERVYIRAVVLRADDHRPLPDPTQSFFEVTGPKGNVVASGYGNAQDSVAGMAWDIPEGQPGGEYKVTVNFPALGIPPGQRAFDVRAYRAPRLKTQIEFLRDGYGPGDRVAATLEATRAEGGYPEGAKVQIVARVDGQEVHNSSAVIDGAGNCSALFQLPDRIERGEGALAFVIDDGGAVETATKTIPILLQTVDLSVYPEGGDLVAGLPCRVYLQAKTPAQKPADISGVVEDASGSQKGTFRTEHEGRGRFIFVPEKDASYRLRITEPTGIRATFPLPPVQSTGTTLSSLDDVVQAGVPVKVKVLSTESGPLTVTLRKREVELATVKVIGKTAGTIKAQVALKPPASADGVLVVTVWDARNKPLAERLVFRRSARTVKITVSPDRERYVPAGQVTLDVKAEDDQGQPAEAVVGLVVTDDSVLEMIEKREQAPRLPVMVLIEDDVQDLADAHVYLDPENSDAPRAVDLLLGTQGWRRFALMQVDEFLKKYGDDARRALASRIIPEPPTTATFSKRAGVAEGMEMDDRVLAVQAAPMPMAMPPGAPMPKDQAAAEPLAEAPMMQAEAHEIVAPLEDLKALKEEGAVEAKKKDLGMQRMQQAPGCVVIREYAHQIRPDRKPNDRVDFSETLYWHVGVKTDKGTGKAKVSFGLSDAVTSFRVFSDAFTSGGVLGSGTSVIESVQPFYVEPKMPLEVTMGDRILLPVGVVNGTQQALTETRMTFSVPEGLKIEEVPTFGLEADERLRRIVPLLVGQPKGAVEVIVDASAGPYVDRVTRPLRVVPRGFPMEIGQGGTLQPDTSVSFVLDIPATRVQGSVKTRLVVYPAPLASLTEAMERLIQEPCGCFEQTSSSTYPLVMAQQYFLSHQGVAPELVQRSREILGRGYERLLGFECKERGYEWFGEDPGHEALTAYGLLEFSDMAQVHTVDPEMLARTRTWLLGTRDGQGGFKRMRRALHTWIVDEDCSNAYITWSLLSSKETPQSLAKEIQTVTQAALKSDNSYVIALGANVARLAKDDKAAETLAARLADRQSQEGIVEKGTTTIVGSAGISLQVETTSLALLAWIPDPARIANVMRSMQWLSEVCKAGRYGSTQATVLALRAILAYDASQSKPKAPGAIHLRVDGIACGGPWAFDEMRSETIQLTDIAELLEPGKHTIEIAMKAGSTMPCSVAVTYSDEKPNSSQESKVDLSVALASETLDEGGVTEANVKVTNKAEDDIITTPIAIIGLPGGLEVRHDQMKELVKAGRIAAYEVLGREVVLYWRELKAQQTVEVPLSLLAAIPGTYVGPASRAYQYYADEFKTWADPLRVEIRPVGP